MGYKKENDEKWVKVPVKKSELEILKIILKREKSNLRIFFQDCVKKKLTSVTLIF